MSETDPTKMKVVELRSELNTRGLDSKGNKAVLVKRLKTALAKEAGAVADENGADITGEFDTSYESQEDDTRNESQIDAEDEILKADPAEDLSGQNEVPPFKEDEILGEEMESADVAADENEDAPAEDADGEQANTEEKMEEETTADNGETKEGDAEVDGEAKTDGEAKNDDEAKTDGEAKGETKDATKSGDDKSKRGQKRRHSGAGSRDRREKVERKEIPPPPLEDLEEFDSNLVILDIYVSDLNLKLDATRCGGTPMHTNGFAFMWAGAKAVYGVKEGKVCFEVKVTKKEDVKHLPSEEANPHVVRVGVSDVTSGLQLGEDPLSYGYGGTAKFSTDFKFTDYGKVFSEDDVVQCFLDMDSEPIQLSYSVNGEHQGVAAEIPKEDLKDSALFPHILTKNCTFEVNFGQKEEPFCALPEGYQDYVFIQNIDLEKRVRGPVCPEKKEDCTVLMMCGLPGAGKTHWAVQHVKDNPEKRFCVLGTNSIIDKMKVMGLPRKRNYHGRWEVLIEKSTTCLNKLLDVSCRRRRNYILDQTNVYPSAQRRKMRPFEGFQRKAVVVVPTDDDFKARIEKRTKDEGKDVPEHAVLEMKANFSLPKVNDWFTSVEFTDLQEEEAQKIVAEYRKEGQAAAPRRRNRHDDRRNRDRRSGGGRDRGPRHNGGGGYRRNDGPNRSWNSGGGGRGNRSWGGPDRYMGPSGQGGRNWGARNGPPGGGRNWNQGPAPGSQGRRSWGGPSGRDSRDDFRGSRSQQQSIRYNQPPSGRYAGGRSAPPPARSYGSGGGGGGGGGGYNQGGQSYGRNQSQGQGGWSQPWSQQQQWDPWGNQYYQ